MILHRLIVMIAGWIPRHQHQVIAYVTEENPHSTDFSGKVPPRRSS
jgi:hypothetical protein